MTTATPPNSFVSIDPAPAAVTPRRRQWWRWLLLTPLLISALLFVFTGWLLATPSGTRTAAQFVTKLLPAQVQIGQVRGSLIDTGHGLEIDALRLTFASFHLILAQAQLRWSPRQLFKRRLLIDNLHLHDATLLLRTAPSHKPFVMPSFIAALNITVAQAELKRANFMMTPDELRLMNTPPASSHSHTAVAINHLALAATLNSGVLTVNQLQVDAAQPATARRITGNVTGSAWLVESPLRWEATLAVPQLTLAGLTLAAQLRSRGNTALAQVTGQVTRLAHSSVETGSHPNTRLIPPLDATLDLIWHAPTLTVKTLQLTAAADPATSTPTRLDVIGQLGIGGDQPVNLTTRWRGLRWPLVGRANWHSDSGQLDLRGALAALRYELRGDLRGPGVPPVTLDARGDYAQQRLQFAPLHITGLGGQLVGSGNVTFAPHLRWDVALAATNLNPNWYVPALTGRLNLTAHSRGSIGDGFTYQLKTDTALATYPPAALQVTGRGDRRAVHIDTATVTALGGRIAGNVQVTWAPALDWSAQLTLTDLDLRRYAATWPAQITTGQLVLHGQPATTAATVTNLRGTWQGYPLQLAGQVRQQRHHITVRDVVLTSGANQVRVNGSIVGNAPALTVDINAPQVHALLPAAGGQLQLRGSVTGSHWTTAQCQVQLTGRDLTYAKHRLAQVRGQATFGVTPPAPLQLQLTAAPLVLNGQTLERVQLDARGSVAQHQLTVTATAPAWNTNLLLAGDYATASGEYRGTVREWRWSQPHGGQWQLHRPATLTYVKHQLALGPLCVRDAQQSTACVTVQQPQPQQFKLQWDSERLALALLQPLLPNTVQLSGALRSHAQMTWRDGRVNGEVTLALPQAAVQMTLPDGRTERLTVAGGQLIVRGTAQQLTAQLQLPVTDLGTLHGRLQLPSAPLAAVMRQRLRGEVQLDLPDLGRVARYLPQLEQVRGQLHAQVTLGGTLAAPQPQGQINLTRGSFRLPTAGLAVTDLTLTATTPMAQRVELSGRAHIGGKTVTLTGSGQQTAAGWQLEYRLRGQKLKLIDNKEYFALLSADLHGDMTPAGGSLRGQVRIPEARIRPRSLPAGVESPSPDVVVKRPAATAANTAPASAAPFQADVTITLGDAVTIEAFGLRGRLRGKLRAIKTPAKPLRGDGQLEVVDGSYRLSSQLGVMAAVGRPLTIEQGLLVFAHTPLDDPGLVLNAQRSSGDIAAGVRVLGTLKQPKLAFFSESDPSLTQADITSYLITGIPPKREASTADRTVSVGTYIAPKLFLEYENSVGGQTADKVKLRYDLSKRIEIQTETGETQGADVFFKFEN